MIQASHKVQEVTPFQKGHCHLREREEERKGDSCSSAGGKWWQQLLTSNKLCTKLLSISSQRKAGKNQFYMLPKFLELAEKR